MPPRPSLSSRPSAASKPKSKPTKTPAKAKAPSTSKPPPTPKKDAEIRIPNIAKSEPMSAATLALRNKALLAETEREKAEAKEVFKEEFRKTFAFKSHYSTQAPLYTFLRRDENTVVAVQRTLKDAVQDGRSLRDEVLRGKEGLNVNGRIYWARNEVVTEEFLRHIPESVYGGKSGKKPNKLIRFEEVVDLPPLPSEAVLKVKRTKPKIVQPTGMMMRYKPFGTDDSSIEEIHSPSGTESDEEEKTARKTVVVARREKRRASDMEDESSKRVRFQGEGGDKKDKKEKKDKKDKEKKEKKKEKKEKKEKKSKE